MNYFGKVIFLILLRGAFGSSSSTSPADAVAIFSLLRERLGERSAFLARTVEKDCQLPGLFGLLESLCSHEAEQNGKFFIFLPRASVLQFSKLPRKF